MQKKVYKKILGIGLASFFLSLAFFYLKSLKHPEERGEAKPLQVFVNKEENL